MSYKINLLALVIGLIVLVGCKDKQKYTKMNSVSKTSEVPVHKIVINEFMNGGGYTYINVNEEGKDYWMAIPNTEVEKGMTFYYTGGLVMKEFNSEELDRTFDEIIFADKISTTKEMVSQPKANPHEPSSKNVPSKSYELIEQPSNGTDLVTILTNRNDLNNKSVVIKGKVIKVNNGILDKNWVHIVDGTGFENKKAITITTQEKVKVDDIVTFKGIVTLNKDFGYGYVYDILIEEGELVQ